MQNQQNHPEKLASCLNVSMHGLGGLHPTSEEKPTILVKARDTLESVVQQAATLQNQNSKQHIMEDYAPTSVSSIIGTASSTMTKKRARSDTEYYCGRNFSTATNMFEEFCGGLPSGGASGCASASRGASLYRDNTDTTTRMTWASLESDQTFKKKSNEEHSACHFGSDVLEQDDRDSKAETCQTNTKRRNRTAATHNQSERKRRDRINQRLKALQKLVPNASKTDKASMLDEVINYLKQLQAQIQIMNMTNMPQMMVPLAMQQQLQMSMQLARIGAMGMVNMNNLVQPTSIMMPASLVQARAHASPNPEPSSSGINASIPLPNPYCTNLTQLVNMEILNSMAALYQKQMSQNNQSLEQQLDTNAP